MQRCAFVSGLSLAIFSGSLVLAGTQTAVGKHIDGFTLKDTAGRAVSLEDFKDKKAVVLLFIGTQCPINNSYMPRLAELSKTYAARGVQFLAINSNCQDTPEKVARHAKEFALPFPVLKDPGNVVADQVGAERTPQAVILDANRDITYSGRIDDQFGIGIKRTQPVRTDLANALDETLSGRRITTPTTEVAGCLIARVAKSTGGDGGATGITYSNQIVRIVQKNCQDCHRPGRPGPMSLLEYDDVVAWGETIREVLKDGRMPPWYADPKYGHFSNDRRLADQDKAALLDWLDHGMPKGRPEDMPPPRQFVQGWSIGQPDLVLEMPEAFDVPADMPKNGVPYQHFRIDTKLKEDRWVERAEARPDAAAVVHHIVVFIVPPKTNFWAGNPRTPTLVGTAPGDMPLILKPGEGKLLPAGSELVFEMHYTPNGTAQKDRSKVGLIFAKSPPKYQVNTIPVANVQFNIPAGADNYEVTKDFTFRRDGYLLSFMPHMHLRGKDFRYEAVTPDGKRNTLLSVPRYDFNWQTGYRLAEPLIMAKGSKVHCVAHFDNSDKNPNNPNPNQSVHWGDQTWEEMMVGWMEVAYERK
jgi:peroxiredoxin